MYSYVYTYTYIHMYRIDKIKTDIVYIMYIINMYKYMYINIDNRYIHMYYIFLSKNKKG